MCAHEFFDSGRSTREMHARRTSGSRTSRVRAMPTLVVMQRGTTSCLLHISLPNNACTDADLAAVVAYARQLPPVRNALPGTQVGPIIKALDLAGQVTLYAASTIDHATPHMANIANAPTVEFAWHACERHGAAALHEGSQ